MILTDRLQKAADLVPASRVMADIGTDHAYLPLYLVAAGRVRRAIACDIHEGPGERAREHVASAGKSASISVRVGPGLAPLALGEVEGVTICGMGGLMIRDILAADLAKVRAMKWLVLQPQNHVAELKQYLCRAGFPIEVERLSLDGGQLYEMMRVRPGRATEISLLEAEVGVTAAYREDPLFPRHLARLIRKRDIIIANTAAGERSARTLRIRARALEEKAALEALLPPPSM